MSAITSRFGSTSKRLYIRTAIAPVSAVIVSAILGIALGNPTRR